MLTFHKLRIRIFLLLLVVFAIHVQLAYSQFTNVSAVVQDTNGNLYPNCSYAVDYVYSVGSSQNPLLSGSPFQMSYGGAKCDSFAAFSIRLPDNNSITPTGSKWRFSICDSTGTKCFTSTITITGANQVITSTLSAAAPSNAPLGGAALLTGNNVFTGSNTFAGITDSVSIAGKKIEGVFQADQWGVLGDAVNGGFAGTPNTAAYNTLLAAAGAYAANANTGAVIHLPAGAYRFTSAPNPLPANVNIQGDGRNLTWIIADYNEATDTNGFFTMNSGPNYIRDLKIFKGGTATGGTAIKFVAQSCGTRSGFSDITHVDINFTWGATSGYWDHHFIADGSACTASGTQGIRDIRIEDGYWAGSRAGSAATFTNYSIVLWNVVHAYIDGLVTFVPVAPDTKTNMLISGAGAGTSASNNVYAANLEMIGDIALDQAQVVTLAGSASGTYSTTSNTQNSIFIGNVLGTSTVTNQNIVVDPTHGIIAHTPSNVNRLANLNVVNGGDDILYGHSNTGYISSIGAFSASGQPEFCFYCYHSSTASTFKRASASNLPMQLFVQDSSGSGSAIVRTAPVGTVDADIVNWHNSFTFINPSGAGWYESASGPHGGGAGLDICDGDSTAHVLMCSYNNGTFLKIPQVVATGAAVLGTSAVNSATCATTVTGSATGATTASVVHWSLASDPNGVTGYAGSGTAARLDIYAFPTANTVNFRVCNNTAGSITPGAMSVNWDVTQ